MKPIDLVVLKKEIVDVFGGPVYTCGMICINT